MKPTTQNGGTAFPCHGPNGAVFQHGMTLRQYAAIHAPEKEVAACMPEKGKAEWLGIEEYKLPEHYPMAIAKARMVWADAMIAASDGKEVA